MKIFAKIDKPLQTLLLWLAVAQLLILTMLVAGAVAYTHTTKSRIALQIAQSLRNELLAGDYRDATLIASTAVGPNFKAISFERNDGAVVFAVPVGLDSTHSGGALEAQQRIGVFLSQAETRGSAVGSLYFTFDRFELVPAALASWLLFLIIGFPAYWFAYRALEKKHAADLEAKNALAIARTTTMLAHDVRKPFSMLKMALGMIGRASDPAGVKAVLAKIVPEVNRAMGQVNGMLEDLLEVGSTSTQLIQEPVSPEALIEQTLGEIFRVYPKADVTLAYRFGHTHAVNVHAQKVGRVFSNIVGNAVQAMNLKGQIWFSTRETTVDNSPFVEFTLGNAGSVIPPENLTKLFEAFFTSGKKGGTGLGLAIAQKVVAVHGGRIWCESERTDAHPDGQVEFKFTLPVAVGQPAKAAGKLPQHSSEVTRELLVEADQPSPTSPDATELALEAAILDLAKAKGRPLEVLVVDDEAIYRAALVSSLARTPELAAAVTVSEAQDGAEGLAKLVGLPDLAITDVDMGHQVDGFDLVEAMRAAGFNGLVCVHSNRMVAEDHRAAFESGADAFIPKPMARAQLLKLVIQARQKARAPERQGAVAATSVAGKPEVLIVEDNIFIQEAWQFALSDEATVHTLGTYEEVVERLETDPGFASRLLLAVTDMHLDGSSGDGLDVGRLLKNHRAGLRVLLSSDGVLTPGELVGAIDRTIGKDPVGLVALSSL